MPRRTLPIAFSALTAATMFSSIPSCERTSPPADSERQGGDPARVRLRLSGELRGMLEPCGCASGQLGGLARRVFKLNSDADYDLLIEGGSLAGGGTELDLQKTFTALSALDFERTRYAAIGIGPLDLEQEPDEYTSMLEVTQVPLVASDLVAKEPFTWPVKAFAERKVGKIDVRIASLALRKPETGTGPKVTLLDPKAAWARALEGAKPETWRVLLVHGDASEVAAAAKLEPRPDLVVGLNGVHHEPPDLPDTSQAAPIVWPAIHGRFLLDVSLVREGERSKLTRYAKVQLEGSPSSPGAMEDESTKNLILAHRHEVAKADVLTRMAERLPTKNGASYVGTKTCGSCHGAALAVWEKSKHAHAWETLEDAASGKLVHKSSGKARYGWPTTAYPDCVSCHVVGYGAKSGFVNATKTPHLTDVGCESCHGAGSRHVDAQLGKIPKAEGKLGRCDPVLCTACHNFEQSPSFDYAERWKKIQHGK